MDSMSQIPEIKEESLGYSANELLTWPKDDLESIEEGRLALTSPLVLAHFLERLDVDDRRVLLRKVSLDDATDVLSEMDIEDAAEVVGEMSEDRAVQILEDFEPDDAADVVGELDDDDRTRLLQRLEPETAEKVINLLSYEPETAGGIMTPDLVAIDARMTVNQAIDRIRELSEEMEELYYVYVVDHRHLLKGVISLRKLILAKPNQSVSRLMNTEIKGLVTPEVDREQVALLMAEYNLPDIPVVDNQGVLLGRVTHDDILDILQDEATEDIQKIVGAGGDESIHDEITYSVQRRLPWLQVNLATAFAAAAIILYFEEFIGEMPILAAFMPIIASLGGNAGHQTLAVAIRSLALNEIDDSDSRRIIVKEMLLGTFNGVAVGLVAGTVSFLAARYLAGSDQGFTIGVVVFMAMILNMGISGLAGAFIPLFLKKMHFDPAQSSSIFLTAVTDTAGFFIFLFLGYQILVA